MLYATDNGWGRIIISDSKGNIDTLFIVNNPDINLSRYELPPLPPAGIFDIRFDSQRSVENISSGPKILKIYSAVYPVKIRIENAELSFKDVLTGKILDVKLQDRQEFSITLSGIDMLSVEGKLMTDVCDFDKQTLNYQLKQNYPNPFNPSTVIGFSLPSRGSVVLKVYSMLGQEIATLVNGEMNAGEHKVKFNASGLPGGMYIYKLWAGSFSAAKKLMLVK